MLSRYMTVPLVRVSDAKWSGSSTSLRSIRLPRLCNADIPTLNSDTPSTVNRPRAVLWDTNTILPFGRKGKRLFDVRAVFTLNAGNTLQWCSGQ